jgi:hypothetical protein
MVHIRGKKLFRPCLRRCCGFSTPVRSGICSRKSELQNCAQARFQAWCRDETLRRILTDVANDLRDRGVWTKRNASLTRPSPSFGQGRRRGDRTHRARKRHENRGDCRSPWIAAFGQHACGKPSRSPLGTAVLRLLHDRSQARKLDWRSRLRQRSTGRRIATRWH